MFLDPEEKKGNSCWKVTGDFAELHVMIGGKIENISNKEYLVKHGDLV